MHNKGIELIEQMQRTQGVDQSSLALMLRLHLTCPVGMAVTSTCISRNFSPPGVQDGSAERALDQMRHVLASHRRWRYEGVCGCMYGYVWKVDHRLVHREGAAKLLLRFGFL